jgi:hypothetical protein
VLNALSCSFLFSFFPFPFPFSLIFSFSFFIFYFSLDLSPPQASLALIYSTPVGSYEQKRHDQLLRSDRAGTTSFQSLLQSSSLGAHPHDLHVPRTSPPMPDISFPAPLARGAPPLAMAAARAELLHGTTPAPMLASRWHPSPMPRLVELLHRGVILQLFVVPSSTTSSAPSSRRIELLHHGGLLHAYVVASVFRCGPSGAGLDRINQL